MGYSLRDHTADVAVEGTGSSVGGAFAAVADGMAAAMCREVPDRGDRHGIEVTAKGLEALLFDYLDELIYQRDVRSVLPVAHRATVSQGDVDWQVTASYRGVPFSSVDARDLKAVTYSDMEVVQSDDGWQAYVVFDV